MAAGGHKAAGWLLHFTEMVSFHFQSFPVSLILASLIQPVVSTKGWNCCVWCLKHFFGKISNMHRCFCVDVGFALTHASAPHAAQVILALMDTDHLGPATWSIKTYWNHPEPVGLVTTQLPCKRLCLNCLYICDSRCLVSGITLNYIELLWITTLNILKHPKDI
jgi:hypothetical protein